MKYRYSALRITLFFACFTTIQIHASVQPTNPVEYALYHCYIIFNPRTLIELKHISRHANACIKAAEDRYYSVEANDLSHTASVKSICSTCFKEECLCDKHKYRGLFCITTRGKKEYTVYLPASESNKIIEANDHLSHFRISIANFNHIFNIQCKPATIPRVRIPTPVELQAYREIKGTFKDCTLYLSYNQTSKPYFIKDTHEIGILAGIPNKRLNATWEVPRTETVYECTLAMNTGTYKTRMVFFEFDDKRYPFGLLLQFPALYQEYLTQVESQSCNAIRTDSSAIFSSNTFYTNSIKESAMVPVLSKMFATFDTCITNFFCPQQTNSSMNNSILYDEITDHNELIYFSWCMHLCSGDWIQSLNKYETCLKRHLPFRQGYRSLYLKPLTGIYNTRSSTITGYLSKYQKCTTFSEVQALIENLKHQIQIFKISDTNFLEIRKKESKHTIYHWCFTKNNDDTIFTDEGWYCNSRKFIAQDGNIQEAPVRNKKKIILNLINSLNNPSIQKMESLAIETINLIFLDKKSTEIYSNCVATCSADAVNLFSCTNNDRCLLLPHAPKVEAASAKIVSRTAPLTNRNPQSLYHSFSTMLGFLHPRNVHLWIWKLAYRLRIWVVPSPNSGHDE